MDLSGTEPQVVIIEGSRDPGRKFRHGFRGWRPPCVKSPMKMLRQVDHIALKLPQQPALGPQADQLVDQFCPFFSVDDDNRRLLAFVDECEIVCSGSETETKLIVRGLGRSECFCIEPITLQPVELLKKAANWCGAKGSVTGCGLSSDAPISAACRRTPTGGEPGGMKTATVPFASSPSRLQRPAAWAMESRPANAR